MPRSLIPLLALLAAVLIALFLASGPGTASPPAAVAASDALPENAPAPAPAVPPGAGTALFAGGCFWCMETAFEGVPGVLSATSGFAGGKEPNPTYEQVSSGTTGHAESVFVVFDPKVIGYERLLSIFWHNIDPLAANAQFCDHGTQYRSAIFWKGAAQKAAAEASRAEIASSMKFPSPITTQIVEAGPFYPAENYHQDYYRKNPVHYQAYRLGCGRDARLRELWGAQAGHGTASANGSAAPATAAGATGSAAAWTPGAMASFRKPPEAELRARLTPEQFEVTQHEATERAFANEYYDNHAAGIYVDVVSGEPLFSSLDKYDSGSGWPAFSKPLDPANISDRTDASLYVARTEVRSKHADSHLGHVFDDGPPPTGLRYCINSAALRFVPADRLEAEGYGQYRALFTAASKTAPSHSAP